MKLIVRKFDNSEKEIGLSTKKEKLIDLKAV